MLIRLFIFLILILISNYAALGVKSDGDIIHDVDGTLKLAQAVMEADGDIELYADKLVFAPGYTHSSWSDGKNSHSSTTVHPSKFKSHNITVIADDDLEDIATEWIAAGNLKFISRYGNVIGRAAFNTNSSSYQDKKHSSSSSSSTAVPPKYRTRGSLTIESTHGNVNMHATEMHTNGIKFVTPHGDVNLIAVYDKRRQSSSSSKKGLFKTKSRSSGGSSATARECVLDAGSGEVEFDVGGLVRAEVRAKGSVLRKLLSDSEFDGIVYRLMTDQHHSYSHKHSSLSTNIVTLLSLAAAMAVPGVGSGLAGAIATAGLKAAASQLAVKTAEAKGNILRGMSRLREKGTLKAVFRSMAVAGLTASLLGDASADPNSLPQRFVNSAVKSTINMALDVGMEGVKPGDATKNAAKQTITETVSRTISSQLGKLYHGGALPDGVHEILHGASAFTIEKFSSGSTKKAKSAAAGAISAEVFTKLYTGNATIFTNSDATREDLGKAITTGIELAQLTAAGVATALNLNAEVAANAAYIAAQENGLSHVHYQKAQEAQEEALAMLEQQVENLQTLKGEGCVPTPEEVRASLSTYQKLKADLGLLGIIVTTSKELSMLESGRVKAVGVPAVLAINKGSSLLLSAATHAMKLNKMQSVELRRVYKKFIRNSKDFITQCKTYRFRNRDWQEELGIPKHWEKLPSDKAGGVKFRNPAKPKYDEVRIMAGNKESDFPAQRVPYIKVKKDGKLYDVNGKIVQLGEKGTESHVPLTEFNSELLRILWPK